MARRVASCSVDGYRVDNTCGVAPGASARGICSAVRALIVTPPGRRARGWGGSQFPSPRPADGDFAGGLGAPPP
eukprot:8148369-Pyramimonas_sp.AAC.1